MRGLVSALPSPCGSVCGFVTIASAKRAIISSRERTSKPIAKEMLRHV
jgi:hypothetical protein